MGMVADDSVKDRVQITSAADTVSCPVDGDTVGEGRSWCNAMWCHVYRLLSSTVGLVLLLFVYTVVGAVILHYIEYDRELQMHAELDAVRRRVVADIINLTTTESRDRRVKSRDVSDVTLAEAVEALVVEYADARESLRPDSKSPGWSFAGAMYYCIAVYTTIGQYGRECCGFKPSL